MTARSATSNLTVIVPVKDGERFVARALRSVIEQQAVDQPQLIVVDDGSTDGTVAVVRGAAPSAVLIAGDGRGPGAARNVGVRAAATELIAFCDADDAWTPDRAAHDLAWFDRDPSLAILLGRSSHESDDPARLRHLQFDGDGRSASTIPSFGAATMRRRAFEAVGPIAEDLVNYEDYDWFLRAREVGLRFVVHDAIAQLCRVREDSFSRTNPATPEDLIATLKRSLDRRRAHGADRSLPMLRDLREEI